jgi:hypothetical protein
VAHGRVDDGLYAGEYLDGNRACAPDILGFDLCVSAGDPVGHGHVVSRGEFDVVELCGAEASRYRGVTGHHCGQLQYVVEFGLCREGGGACQQWGEDARGGAEGLSGCIVLCHGTWCVGDCSEVLSVVFTLKCYWEERRSRPVDDEIAEEASVNTLAEDY